MINRLRYIDVAAGVLLLYMIVEHIQVWFSGFYIPLFSYKNILSFYMPFFFFKSGLLTNAILTKERLYQDLRRFIVSFLLTGFVCYLLMLVRNWQLGELTFRYALLHPIKETFITGSFLSDNPTWFLLSLFIVKYVGDCIIRYTRNSSKGWIIPTIAILSIIVAYTHYKFQTSYTPQLVGNTFSGLFFYMVGYMLKENYLDKWVVILSIIGYGVCLFLPYPYVVMHWNTLVVGRYLLWYPASLFGILSIIGICKWGEMYYSFPVLNWIGKNALYLLCIHWPFLLLFGKIFMVGVLHVENSLILFISEILASAILLPLIKIGWDKYKMILNNEH